VAAEYAKCDDTGLHPTLYAVFDKRGKEGQVHGYGEGGCTVEVGYLDSQECPSWGICCYLASACDIVCDLGSATFLSTIVSRSNSHPLEFSCEEQNYTNAILMHLLIAELAVSIDLKCRSNLIRQVTVWMILWNPPRTVSLQG